MASNSPAYPVFRSPDGKTTQVAATPAREAQLKFAGWQKLTQPRSKKPGAQSTPAKAANASKPTQAAS